MKRKWDNDELTEHWSIDVEERATIVQKKGANRLGFALLLKGVREAQVQQPAK